MKLSKIRQHDRDNLEAARIILSEPERYGGILLEWAKAYIELHDRIVHGTRGARTQALRELASRRESIEVAQKTPARSGSEQPKGSEIQGEKVPASKSQGSLF